MINFLFFLSLLFFSLMAQTAIAVLPPQISEAQEKEFEYYSEQLKNNAPEVLDIHVEQISRRNAVYVAEARVLKVLHTQSGIKNGDLIKIKYSDMSINARKHNERIKKEKIIGPGFKSVLYLLEEEKNARTYLKIDSNNPGFLTLAAGIVSFESLAQQTIPDKQKTPDTPIRIQCSKLLPEICSQDYEPVCGHQLRKGIKCIKAPCVFYKFITFSNSCTACSTPDVTSYTKEACLARQKKH